MVLSSLESRVLPVVPVLLLLFGLLTVAETRAASSWQCRAGPDGEWVCDPVELDPGPIERGPIAPIYRRPQTTPADGRDEARQRVFGQTIEQAELTWVPRQALPAATRENIPEWCAGAYQEQPLIETELGADLDPNRVDVRAREVDWVLGESGSLDGRVEARQGERRATARSASFDERNQTFALEGDVRLQEAGALLLGERASVNLREGDAEIDEARFVFYEGSYRGSADRLEREDGVIRVRNARFTRCEPGNDSWQVIAGRVEIPEDGKVARARNARLNVGPVPVFWTPYLQFPLTGERQSGFLMPSVGYSSESGLDVALPYYLNLAPNYDATLTPRIMTDRGFLGEVEFRHMTQRMYNVLGGAYMPEDDNYDGRFSFSEFRERVEGGIEPPGVFEASERWLVQFRHSGSWFDGFTTAVDFAEASDDDYFRDLGTDLTVNARSEIDRSARMRFRRGGFQAQLWAQDLQVLEPGEPDSYRRLPQFDMSWYARPGSFPLVAGIDAHYARFDRSDDDVTGFDAITGDRAHVVPRLRLPIERGWGWFIADAAYHYTRYDLDDTPLGFDDSPTRSLASGSIDLGLRFERDALLGGTPLLQTLEPRLYYLYLEEEDQSDLPLFDTTEFTFGSTQLFRENRFAGVDRINDADQLTAAVTSRMISRADGEELLQATVGRIFYFDDRDVTLTGGVDDAQTSSRSGWVTELAMRVGAGMDARALWVWDTPDSAQRQRSFQLRYRPDARRVLSFNYRRRGNDVKQFDAGILWPLSTQVSMLARYFYDLEEDRVIETFGGLQYDDCCWRFRLVGRQFRRPSRGLQPTDTETGVFVEVVMKGLAGFDGGLNSILEQGIRGYREHPLNDI